MSESDEARVARLDADVIAATITEVEAAFKKLRQLEVAGALSGDEGELLGAGLETYAAPYYAERRRRAEARADGLANDEQAEALGLGLGSFDPLD